MAGRLTLKDSLERKAEIEKLISDGFSVNKLSAHFSVNRVSMLKYLKLHGLQTNQQKEHAHARSVR